ncbi:ubiquinol-cytochrome c reductase cytochrome c1 subunit [Crenobacter luteus]|uniref:Cytochrome C n=1 Tax=Crenobacter luteus TaxID=1452487 RepID=A0A165FDW3_9NEIS|nr:cytochrome c1 [Crenobacter luteus]KZE32944.1 cytochrome C [Crenobacter luteus]TCP14758.1 ubiquinol-cytochrome c reductase cytochrome c1 subunit [Crenobacter luteus]
MKKTFRHLIAAVALVLPAAGFAAESGVPLEKAPIDIQDTESIQRGAQTFVNYCLSCHSANAMRYNRLMDVALSEEEIKGNLMFASEKIGDTMAVAMDKKDAKGWMGAAPPDLSLIARSRGADWLYSYMRSFYRDPSRDTGWNNLVFDRVGMPHVLWEWQGEQVLKVAKDAKGHESKTLELVTPGTMTKLENGKANTAEYDRRVADLVNYLVFMGEPNQVKRHQIGYVVLMFLFLLLLPFAYFLKKEYWKDIH